MQVIDRLASVVTHIHDKTVSLAQSHLLGHFFAHLSQVRKNGISGRHITQGVIVRLRNEEQMNGRGRTDIVKGQYFVIFINNGSGNLMMDDFAKGAKL
jgi:hypothetical protein